MLDPPSFDSTEENKTSISTVQQQEYETQLVHNIILNLLKRRYELHTVHEKKDKVRRDIFSFPSNRFLFFSFRIGKKHY